MNTLVTDVVNSHPGAKTFARFAICKQNKTPVHETIIDLLKPHKTFFIRDPKKFTSKLKSTKPEKQLLEVVRYLMCEYSVPSFLNNAWYHLCPSDPSGWDKIINHTPYDYNHSKLFNSIAISWFLCVSQGKSLHKEYSHKIFSKKETHFFLNCKYELSFRQAIVFAIARGTGARDGDALRVAKTKLEDSISVQKCGESTEIVLDEFIKGIIRFFAKEVETSINEINDILDFLLHKRRENPNFEFVGRGFTMKSLRKKTKDWHYELRRMRDIGNEVWYGIPIVDQSLQTSEYINRTKVINTWNFKQIKSAKELAKEGNAMHHCVLSYKHSCISGTSSIWSVTLGEYSPERKLTIEIRDKMIVQARGFANRIPRKNEVSALLSWSKRNGIEIRDQVIPIEFR